MKQQIKVGSICIGNGESHPLAFEDATVDYSMLNEYLKHNAAYNYEIHPDAVINNCSQCSMEKINGKPNILGMLHRARYTRVDRFGHRTLDCGSCPIARDAHLMAARDSNGNIVRHTDGTPLTQSELLLKEIDDTE